MSTFIATYTPNINVGLSNYLKVIFSCYRLNNIICATKDNKCVDKDFEYIYTSIFKNKEMILHDYENQMCEHHALNETYPYFKNIYIYY